jgi:hypothetical protein
MSIHSYYQIHDATLHLVLTCNRHMALRAYADKLKEGA